MKCLIIGMALIFSGCSIGQIKSKVDLSISPVNAQAQAKELLGSALLDDSSARYLFGDIKTTTCKRFLASSIQYKVKYLPVSINAKNAFGAYVGYKSFNVLYADGKAVEVVKYVGETYTECPAIHKYAARGD